MSVGKLNLFNMNMQPPTQKVGFEANKNKYTPPQNSGGMISTTAQKSEQPVQKTNPFSVTSYHAERPRRDFETIDLLG